MKDIQLFTSAMDANGRTQALSAFGIDLGTTNSSVAEASWASGEKPVCRVLEIDHLFNSAGTVMKTIRISDEVWDEIAKRDKFGETEDDVLRVSSQ